jgi:hypothetical protein
MRELARVMSIPGALFASKLVPTWMCGGIQALEGVRIAVRLSDGRHPSFTLLVEDQG